MNGMKILTDEECDRIRRLPCDFNDMIRAAYNSGYVDGFNNPPVDDTAANAAYYAADAADAAAKAAADAAKASRKRQADIIREIVPHEDLVQFREAHPEEEPK